MYKNILFTILIVIISLLHSQTVYSQGNSGKTNIAESFPEKDNSDNFTTDDYTNPINFTTIEIRQPASNGKSISRTILNRSSHAYIRRGSNIHLSFKRRNVKILTDANLLNLRIVAFIKRKDNTIKPLSASGLTQVKPDDGNTSDKQFEATAFKPDSNENSKPKPHNVKQSYTVNYLESTTNTLSSEINLADEDVSVDDKVIITIINTENNGVDYTITLTFFDDGWKVIPTGGFSFINTLNDGDQNFKAGGSTGMSFHYQLRPSASFVRKFFNPSFGPEVNVMQDADSKTIVGAGLFITEFMNTVKVGAGWNLNDDNNGFYLSLGLNFIEGWSTITEAAKKAD